MNKHHIIIALLTIFLTSFACLVYADESDNSVMQAYYWDDAQKGEDDTNIKRQQIDDLQSRIDQQNQTNSNNLTYDDVSATSLRKPIDYGNSIDSYNFR